MSIRLWRRFKIMKGVTLNVSKSGVSITFGKRGVGLTINSHGIRHTIGKPGTGIFHTKQHSYEQLKRAVDKLREKKKGSN